MTPTTTADLAIAEIDAKLAQARLDLATAEAAETTAFAAVSSGREQLALGAIVARVLASFKISLSQRQEATAQAASAAKAWEKLAGSTRDRMTAATAHERAERSAVLRVQSAALEARIGHALVDMRSTFAAIGDEVAAFNRDAAGSMLSTLRGPGTYACYERLEDGLTVLQRFFPPPKPAPPAPIRVPINPIIPNPTTEPQEATSNV